MQETDWTWAAGVAWRVLREGHGVAPLRALVAAGLTRHQVAALFRREELRRPRVGWYLEPDLPWCAGPAVRVGGAATCVSAAASWGLPVPPDPTARVHVRLDPNASRLRDSRDRTRHPPAGTDPTVRLHWTVLVDPPSGWRVGVVDALLQLADCVQPEWFVAALDAALHQPRHGQRILDEAGFARVVEHLPERLLPALRLVDARAESCIETLLRLGLVARGVSGVDLQVWITPNHRVDLLLHGRLIVEADGEQFHDAERDAARDALMRRLGFTVLRFPYRRIVFELDAVLDEIEAALAALPVR